MALSVKRVSRLLAAGKPGRHLDGGRGGVRGLYLIVRSPAAASWQLRYQLHKRPHWMGLGSAAAFSLAEARQRAKRAQQQLADKIDPLQSRHEERAAQLAASARAISFREAAEAYVADHRAGWSLSHGSSWTSTLAAFVYPRIGRIDVGKIGMPEVLGVLEQHVEGGKRFRAGKFWEARTVTADRVRNRVELVLNFAQARGHRPQSEPNPAAWDQLKHVLPAVAKLAPVARHAAVPYRDIPALVEQLRARPTSAAKALLFTALTAARTGEALDATWDEINLDYGVWTIPASRMKARREHRVPLAPQAIALLRALPTEKGNPYLFIGTRGAQCGRTALFDTFKSIGRSETIHGLRSSFSDWAHEQTAFSNHVIELCLAHQIGSEVEQAYRRSDLYDKRAQLMRLWASYCMGGVIAGEVVLLRGAQ